MATADGEMQAYVQDTSPKLGLYRKPSGKQTQYENLVVKVIKPGSLGGYQNHSRETKGQWRGVARSPRLKNLLFDTATMLGHISFEATQAAHYHVYRCLENGIDLGPMDFNGFWYKIFDAIKDLRYGEGLHHIDTPLYDSLREYEENAPLRRDDHHLDSDEPFGIWDLPGHMVWRHACLKAAAKTKEQNLGVILQTNAYHNLGKVIKVRIAEYFGDTYADNFRSLVSAIAKCIWDDQPLEKVKEGYKRLSDLTQEEIRDIACHVIDPIREKFPDETGRKDNSKMIQFVYFVMGEVIEYNRVRSRQRGAQIVKFVNVCVGQQLANDIEREMGNLSKKKFVLFMKHALDIFRQCSGSDTSSVCRDIGIRCSQRVSMNGKYRSYILRRLSERILYQTENSMLKDELVLDQHQTMWIDRITAQLQLPSSLSEFESKKDLFVKYLREYIVPKLRESNLCVAQRDHQNGNNKIPWGRKIVVPSILPLAKKRACHVSIPNDAITSLAKFLAEEDKDIEQKITPMQIILSEAKERKMAIEKEIDERMLQEQTDEEYEMVCQIERNKIASEKQFRAITTGKIHKYKMRPEETAFSMDRKKRKEEYLSSSEGFKQAEKEWERAKLLYQECCWMALFNIKVKRRQDAHEWLFGGELSTDGVDVSMQYYRIKTDEEVEAGQKEKKESGKKALQRKTKRTGKKPAGSGSALTGDKSDDISSQADWRRAKDVLKDDLSNLCVFDPGPSGHVGIRMDRSKFDTLKENRKHGDHDPFKTIHLSNHEMRARSGKLKRMKLKAIWSESKPKIRAWNATAPSRKVATTAEILDFCTNTNSQLHHVYGFYSQNCFRRQRFSVYSRTQHMLDMMVEKICGTSERKVQEKTVVVFGNAAINSGECRTGRICLGELKRLLRQRCCYIEVDEFRSSQYCCACQTKLEPPPRVGLHKRWKVRRCINNDCERAFWQRDVNAAINLAKFFLWEVHGEDKDKVFRRPCRLDEDDVPDV